MPRLHLMSWEGHPNYRWVKKHKGVRYRVTCQELGAKFLTKEATAALANEWWLKKKAEIDGPSSERGILIDEAEMNLHPMVIAGEAANRIIDALVEDPRAATDEEIRRCAEAIIGQGSIDDDRQRTELLAAVRALVNPNAAATEARSVKANGETFLETARGDMKPRSFQELRDYIRSLSGEGSPLAGDPDVKVIDENLVERTYLALRASRLSAGAKKKRWGFFRRFVGYVSDKRLIEVPRNLSKFRFKVRPQKIKVYPLEEVKQVLAALTPRLRLYALLGLNCGMTNVDIGRLTKGMVDLKEGVLTRKRVKTEDEENVPTVSYRLWPETLELLREHQSSHPELFLTGMTGAALWECRYEGKEARGKDMIVQQWRRAKVAVPLKAFRSISSTLIETHAMYGRYVIHFLGQSPKGVAYKNYVAPSQELFDAIMLWLRGQLFGC